MGELQSGEPALNVKGAWRGRPRILVVEDDEDLCAGLQWTLSRSYEVSAQPSALAALRWCAVCWPDLLIVDFQLPDLDGVELLRVLRQSSRIRSPALMISAYEERAVRAIRGGFDEFIPKPISEGALAVAIERTLGL